ncbi:MAG: protein CpxP [Patiriisocius sp.]|jgi:protein CpxP
MNKLQLYKYAILGLVLLNIAVLSFFILNNQSHHRPHHDHFKPKGAIEDLHLTEDQHEKFISFANWHRSKMDSLGTLQKEVLEKYFTGANNSNENNQALLLDEANQVEREKLVLTSKHFEDIRSILKEDQLQYLDPFIKKLTRNILGSRNRRPDKRHY